MIRSGRDFWMFQATFWVLAAVALFLYGLTYGHVQVALVCSLYNPLVGFGYSYLIRQSTTAGFRLDSAGE